MPWLLKDVLLSGRLAPLMLTPLLLAGLLLTPLLLARVLLAPAPCQARDLSQILDSSSTDKPISKSDKLPANPYIATSTQAFPALAERLKHSQGFAGGDSAYSIKLSPNKALWLFGDSFYRKTAGQKRMDCEIVRNAIALDDPSKTNSVMTFYLHSQAFFRAPQNIFWPGDGVMLDGRLYLFCHEIETSKARLPTSTFNPYTDYLLVVQNPLADPGQWRWHRYRLGNRSSQKMIGIACLLEGDYVYVYCSNLAIGRALYKVPTSLARIKTADLLALPVVASQSNQDQPGQIKFEWFAQGWQKEAAFVDLLWDDGAEEMSVTKLRGLPGFFAFYLPPRDQAILMRHAVQPQGPWSAPVKVYQFSQPAGKLSSDIYFYSAKAHPEYDTTKGEVVLTYCSSSKVLGRVLNDQKLYFPEAVKIKIAPAK